jgi:hypothetical protein
MKFKFFPSIFIIPCSLFCGSIFEMASIHVLSHYFFAAFIAGNMVAKAQQNKASDV